MIRCSRCGKIYDYDKYNGICPVCARYNRKDSNNQAEQELHRKYDSNPWAHMADNSHRETHRVNQDSYRHRKDEYAPGHGTYSGQFVRQEAAKKARAKQSGSRGTGSSRKNRSSRLVTGLIAAVIILVCFASIFGEISDGIGASGIIENIFGEQQSDGYDIFDDAEDAADDPDLDPEEDDSFSYMESDVENDNEVYVKMLTTDLNIELDDPGWEPFETFTAADQEELRKLQKEGPGDGYVFGYVSVYMLNHTSEPCDLSDVEFEFSTEDGEAVQCLRRVGDTDLVIDSFEGGNVEWIVAVPETQEEVRVAYTVDGVRKVYGEE